MGDLKEVCGGNRVSAASNERALAATGAARGRAFARLAAQRSCLASWRRGRAALAAGKQRGALFRPWRDHGRPANGPRTPPRLRLRQGRVYCPMMTPRSSAAALLVGRPRTAWQSAHGCGTARPVRKPGLRPGSSTALRPFGCAPSLGAVPSPFLAARPAVRGRVWWKERKKS